jgi:two-component system cell cycle sensor histidine kinase/response regulator CckA
MDQVKGKWQNLGRKLPLLTTALLCVMVVAVSGTAYREMKRSLVAAAGERVVNVAKQVAGAFAVANERARRDGSPLSRDSAFKAALLRPDSLTLAAAQRRLTTELASNPLLASVQLWNAKGERVLLAGEAIAQSPPDSAKGSAESPQRPLLASHDTIFTDANLAVLGSHHDTLGFVRELSRVSSAEAKQLLSGLIGGQAVLLVGNVSGDVWTNLSVRVPSPGVKQATGAMVRSTSADGTHWIGALTPVPRATWLIWVALPESVINDQMRGFLLRILFFSLGIVALGAFGAWWLSRHVIAPIGDVIVAAEALAAGFHSSRAAVVRHDEIGRLAIAFNIMADAMQVSHLDLENQQVELETQQSELEEANEELRMNVDEATNAMLSAVQSQARASAIVDGAIGAVIIVDEHGKIVEFNPGAEETFGCTAAEAIGQSFETLVPATRGFDGHADLRHYLERRGDLSRRKPAEVSALRSDASEFSAEFTVTQIPMPGPPMFACFLRDLSERKQLEAQLHQSHKMEAVGRLAGGVAHDFNNILTVIISYTDLVLAEASVVAPIRTDLVQVRTAADRATALTRQLLAFSRKQILHPAVLDMNTIVDDVYTMLARVIPTSIRLERSLGESIAPVYVDRGQLEQVLMNLAVNARDAMPDGGSLTIETANATLDQAYVALHPGGRIGDHVVLSVRDTGVGMDADTRQRIFEPFFTTKAPGQGTGLGLATVYGIVQQSGGSVYVYSEEGQGTTFKVYFPVYAGTDDVDEVMAPALLVGADPVAVLLVEDDPAVRGATELVLTRLGHRVVPAADVAEALGILRSDTQQFDAVVTDAVMPGQSGLDLAEILRAERPELAVVLMSGYTEEAVSGTRSVPTSVVFVEKPFTGAGISQALAEALSAVRYANQGRATAHISGPAFAAD